MNQKPLAVQDKAMMQPYPPVMVPGPYGLAMAAGGPPGTMNQNPLFKPLTSQAPFYQVHAAHTSISIFLTSRSPFTPNTTTPTSRAPTASL